MNVIFDLGGVVFSWTPGNIINRFFNNDADKILIKEFLFNHNDWINLDRGTITKESVVERTAQRSGFNKDLIRDILESVPKELTPILETTKLFDLILKNNHKLYVLSNMHKESVSHILTENNFWDKFEGIVFSCDINMVKPDKDIFNYILNEYSLNPEECVFIDDTFVNIEAAEKMRINTIHFKDPIQCRAELEAKGIL